MGAPTAPATQILLVIVMVRLFSYSSHVLFDTRMSNPKQILNEYVCPISHMLMADPVVAEDGFTYEREEIEQWFGTSGNTSPMTRAKINKKLIPNQSIKSMMVNFLETNPSLVGSEEVYLPAHVVESLCEAIKKKDVDKITAVVAKDKRLLTCAMPDGVHPTAFHLACEVGYTEVTKGILANTRRSPQWQRIRQSTMAAAI